MLLITRGDSASELRHSVWSGDNTAAIRPIRGSGEEELMTKALMGALAAAGIALTPLCIPPARAQAGDPCAVITDPAAYQTCIGKFRRDNPIRRYPLGNCEGASAV